MSDGYFRTYADPGVSLQQPFEVAVVIPTLLRPTLADALKSIFAQHFRGRTQILLGVDVPQGDLALVEVVCAARPSHCVVQLFHPGYSTSVRHGGLCEAQDGGVLRQLLSLLANSSFIAYLDDDNWWDPQHLALLTQVIPQVDYAFTHRWFVHPRTGKIVHRDDWESVGPGKGIYAEKYGGFVDPSCLMIDKRKCADILPLWSRPQPFDAKGMSADRTVFQALAPRPGFRLDRPTVYYRLDPADTMHAERMKVMVKLYEEAGAGGQ
jgi:hypothetical protein